MKISRRFYVRSIALVLLVLLFVVMFLIGKQHSVLIDNRNVEVNGIEYKALNIVEFYIDNEDGIELAKRDRDQVDVTGQSHKVKVVYTDSNWDEIELERKVKLPLNEDMLLFSIPAFIASPDDVSIYLTPFKIGE